MDSVKPSGAAASVPAATMAPPVPPAPPQCVVDPAPQPAVPAAAGDGPDTGWTVTGACPRLGPRSSPRLRPRAAGAAARTSAAAGSGPALATGAGPLLAARMCRPAAEV